MSHALGVDVGSTNVKVALVAADGSVAATAARPLTSVRVRETAEQDPEGLWSAVVDAVHEVNAHAPAAAASVSAALVCSQYSSIVPVDASGLPVGPLVLWWDQRGTAQSWGIMERHADAFDVFLERHGIPPIGSGLSLAHILHFQHDRPDVHAATSAYLEPMDYVNARLTGRVVATQCTMFMAQVCDNRSVGVTEYDPELVRMSGIDATRLPPLVPVDGTVGPVLPSVASMLGLPDGVTVYAGMNDSHAGAFASGAFMANVGGLAIGTTAVLLDTIDGKQLDLENELVSMPSPIPGRYLAWAENGIAGKSVEHVLEEVLLADDVLGRRTGDDVFAALDAAIREVPPGSNGVLFLPWLAGSLAPNASGSMRGAFLNLSLDTRRTDLVRATVEGTAHNLRWLLPAVESFTGSHIEELRFFGGAARSMEWAQILADVLGRPIAALSHPDFAVARATALVALQREGALDATDLDGLVSVERRFEPRVAHAARYGAMHEQFVAAFGALRPIYEALNG